MKSLEETIKELPPDLQREVHDFARFLLESRGRPKQKKLRLTWAGALSEYRDRYTSLELQKKALEWWGD
jgi:Protein of unknown function (DUF2281)